MVSRRAARAAAVDHERLAAARHRSTRSFKWQQSRQHQVGVERGDRPVSSNGHSQAAPRTGPPSPSEACGAVGRATQSIVPSREEGDQCLAIVLGARGGYLEAGGEAAHRLVGEGQVMGAASQCDWTPADFARAISSTDVRAERCGSGPRSPHNGRVSSCARHRRIETTGRRIPRAARPALVITPAAERRGPPRGGRSRQPPSRWY